MTCDSLADIILDMARGAAVPEAARFSVRRHMDTCPSCAAEYARQQELTTALQALAAEAQEWSAPAGMEQRLLTAFAAQHGKAAPDAHATAGRWRYVLATAAMLTLAVWGITREAGKPASQGTREPAGNGVAAGISEGRAISADLRPATPPAVSEPSSQASRTRKPVVSERNVQASRTTNPRTAISVEFVRIPSAIGLPDLESGTVLRMELPLAMLPEYGLEIAPDAMRTSVEADVLVGQDGQPRAIRLVGVADNVAQDSRSRQ